MAYPSNITSIVDLLYYANNETGGLFGMGILIAVGLVTFLTTGGTNPDNTKKAAGASAFLMFLVATILRFMQLLDDPFFWGSIGLLVGTMAWLWFTSAKDSG